MFLDDIQERFLNFTPAQRKALLSASFVAILVALFFFLISRGEAVEAPVLKPITTSSEKSTIYIHVAGKVKKPGLYQLISGARVDDAIKAAGGALPGTDLSEINLARVMNDGEQVYVSGATQSSSSRPQRTPKKKFSGVVNINRASIAQFDSLPGIGPVIAARIIEYRKKNGPFLTLEDLTKVQGIGDKTFQQIKGRLAL